MDAYELLRKQAAEKLDKAIRAARDVYRAEVAKINELRTALGHAKPLSLRPEKSIGDVLSDLYPRDRVFTVTELIINAKAVYPNRRFKRVSVRMAMQRLQERGIIRRVAKEKSGDVLWADAALAVDAKPFGHMSIADVIGEVLEDSDGMRPAELVVAMQGIGFRAEQDPHLFVRKVVQALNMNPRRFAKNEAGKWALVLPSGKISGKDGGKD